MLRNREGFTLIELLIVVVIIGILAAIALPKFGQTRERAYISAATSDLRQLSTAQEMCYQDNNYAYCDALDEALFSESQGVTVSWTVNADGQSFEATAVHAAIDAGATDICAMNAQGVIGCDAGGITIAEVGSDSTAAP